MRRPDRVLVVGGGIAGLATARALSRQGLECTIVERSDGWEHAGAGMYLPANATRALDRLGLRAQVWDRGRQIHHQVFLDDRGHRLLDVDVTRFWGEVGPCVAVERRHLHEALREGVVVRHGVTVSDLLSDGPSTRAVFTDGSQDEFGLVVGADGVRSWMRTAAHGGAAARFLGQVSWRFVVEGAPDISSWTMWMGDRKGFLAIPLPGGRLYCYADLVSAEPGDPVCGDRDALAEVFARFAEPVPTILATWLATRGPAHFSPIEEVVHAPWVGTRSVLVGDAAHAMSPNMAQGAALAFEDALVLEETIARGQPLEAFETRRRPRVDFVRAQTHRRDHTRLLPRSARNLGLRLAGQQIFRGNYAPLREDAGDGGAGATDRPPGILPVHRRGRWPPTCRADCPPVAGP